MRSYREVRGFTLIEVMVAMVIIGIAMVILLSTQVNSTRSYAESKVLTISTLLARRKLAELQAGEFPEPTDESGTFENNDNYQWSLNISGTDLENLRKVTLEVSLAQQDKFEGKPGIPGVTITTYIARLTEPELEEEFVE